jgi:hypothetical protein
MFKNESRQRLEFWKKFRSDLNSADLESALNLVNDFWAKCPFLPYYLDPQQPQNWPDPWQLIQENYYCDLAKCLGIIYTLHLTNHGHTLDPELRIYNDNKTRHQYHIAYLCQGKYVLNLLDNQIVNKEHINQELKLVRCYTARDLQLEKY